MWHSVEHQQSFHARKLSGAPKQCFVNPGKVSSYICSWLSQDSAIFVIPMDSSYFHPSVFTV